MSEAKQAFDRKLAAELPNIPQCQLRDLRRTARSLMSHANVPSEHAERVPGHAIEGVKGVYDRHSYTADKTAALQKLAALIKSIVHPRPATVLPLERGRKRR